jgi:uncharacterized protein YajQ (UPF0234 family)
MPSFDTVIEPDLVELRNAVEQSTKEIGTRFDFKGSSAAVELADRGAKDRELTLFGDSDFQLQQVRDVLLTRLAKRGWTCASSTSAARHRRWAATDSSWPCP